MDGVILRIADITISVRNGDIMNLASKYRPKTFDEVVEQPLVMKIIRAMCESSELECRNFLFIGSQGVGKTTTSRIIASELNEGKGEPIEIDAASHSGVEDVRTIVQQASQYPVGMKYKVFILDEVHAFSQQAWQALLKVLEEQPAKTVMIMATTNPEKIPATILSRVQTFQLSKISLDGIFNRLKYVLEAEKSEGRAITYEEDAVMLVAKLANGGMRDALTLLDKCLAYSLDVNTDNVIKALDLPNYDTYFALLNGLVKKDNKTITDIVNSVYNSGTNFVKWFESFHSFIANIIKYIYIKDIGATMIPSTYLSKIENYNEQHASLCLKLSNVLLNLNKDLKTTQYLEETALTYLLSPVAKKGG